MYVPIFEDSSPSFCLEEVGEYGAVTQHLEESRPLTEGLYCLHVNMQQYFGLMIKSIFFFMTWAVKRKG